ncbi:hypothetical protein EI555_005245 [Monodon monoceros]|uniref:Uncharacterized protein n=1 Tax=Monodon monoceros TaxID=40151 RepID=A0A4U1F8V8_MONMO|nr:hypothetical protein EI555_005245 [Monodon monoceros]
MREFILLRRLMHVRDVRRPLEFRPWSTPKYSLRGETLRM